MNGVFSLCTEVTGSFHQGPYPHVRGWQGSDKATPYTPPAMSQESGEAGLTRLNTLTNQEGGRPCHGWKNGGPIEERN